MEEMNYDEIWEKADNKMKNYKSRDFRFFDILNKLIVILIPVFVIFMLIIYGIYALRNETVEFDIASIQNQYVLAEQEVYNTIISGDNGDAYRGLEAELLSAGVSEEDAEEYIILAYASVTGNSDSDVKTVLGKVLEEEVVDEFIRKIK